MTRDGKASGTSASQLITGRIAELDDWRGEMLARIRAAINAADPAIVEEWKWMGTPVWSRGGIICTGETYKAVVKMTFFKGAALQDPAGLFNASLEGNTRRAIDIHEGDTLDVPALKALIREAIALNVAPTTPGARKPAAKKPIANKPIARKPIAKKPAVRTAAASKRTTR